MKKLLALSLAAFLLTGCAEMFQAKVDMPTGIGGGSLSGMLSDKAVITDLAAPAQLNVSKGDSSTYIDLNWSAVEGAVSYRIERAEVQAGPSGSFAEPGEELFEELEKAWYSASYRDETARSLGARYYYRVCAENNRDKLEPSPYTPAEYGTLFGIPQQPQADLGVSIDSITVRWNGVDNATGYEVYRSTNPDGSGAVLVSSVTADRLKYTNSIIKDEQGKEFYYTVYAVNRLGIRSPASSIAMGFAAVEGAPLAPASVRIEEGRGAAKDSIGLSWDAVTAVGELTYYVYRSSSEDSALVQIAKLTNNETSYTDSRSLKPGVYYYYQVQASTLDDFGKELKSPFSDSGRNDSEGNPNPKAAEGFVLSPTEELFAEKKVGEASITLKWLPALGNGDEQATYKYKIYAGTSSSGPFSEVLEEVGPSSAPAEGGYLTRQVASRSYYTITTVNSTGTESDYSIIAAPTPYAAQSPDASEAKNVGAQAAANSSGVYPVQITWTRPEDSDLHGFHIYRSTSRDSGYRKITAEPLGINATSYLDSNDTAKAGKKYWYKVLSVNALGQGSHYSEPVQGWGALTHEQYLVEFYKTITSSLKKLTLMHKPGNTEKLGSETKGGTISGTLSYSANISGLGARIIMRYENYADFYIDGKSGNGPYFVLTGNTNTSADMSSNGSMDGTVTCTGMYPGKVYHDNIAVKGGAAGGGTYGVEPQGFGRVEVTYSTVK